MNTNFVDFHHNPNMTILIFQACVKTILGNNMFTPEVVSRYSYPCFIILRVMRGQCLACMSLFIAVADVDSTCRENSQIRAPCSQGIAVVTFLSRIVQYTAVVFSVVRFIHSVVWVCAMQILYSRNSAWHQALTRETVSPMLTWCTARNVFFRTETYGLVRQCTSLCHFSGVTS